MNNLDAQYTALLQKILHEGVVKKDRTGTGTKGIFGYTFRHVMSEGFPILTTKKVFWKGIVEELLWMLRGETNIHSLVEKGVNIWVGDAYKNYLKEMEEMERKDLSSTSINRWMRYFNEEDSALPGVPTYSLHTEESFIEAIKTDEVFALKWGNLGNVYGHQWRYWSHMSEKEQKSQGIGIEGPCNDYIDQIDVLIDKLLKTPNDRRMLVSAWNVAELDGMVLPPCHYGFQVYTVPLSSEQRLDLYKKKIGVEDLFLPPSREHMETHEIPTHGISLLWNQRSVDSFLGLPFNIASYGLLLSILGQITNMVPIELVGNLGDTHLYLNHLEQAELQTRRVGYSLPKIKFSDKFIEKCKKFRHDKQKCFESEEYSGSLIDHLIYSMEFSDFQLDDYKSHTALKAKLSN